MYPSSVYWAPSSRIIHNDTRGFIFTRIKVTSLLLKILFPRNSIFGEVLMYSSHQSFLALLESREYASVSLRFFDVIELLFFPLLYCSVYCAIDISSRAFLKGLNVATDVLKIGKMIRGLIQYRPFGSADL